MKRITLQKGPKHPSLDVFRVALENSPQRPLSVDDIRKRVKVLDAIDACAQAPNADTLVLEDAEHGALKAALDSFPWSVANKELLAVLDDVAAAREVSTAPLKAVES